MPGNFVHNGCSKSRWPLYCSHRVAKEVHTWDKIRQQLQLLRDRGYIKFAGRGRYQKLSRWLDFRSMTDLFLWNLIFLLIFQKPSRFTRILLRSQGMWQRNGQGITSIVPGVDFLCNPMGTIQRSTTFTATIMNKISLSHSLRSEKDSCKSWRLLKNK